MFLSETLATVKTNVDADFPRSVCLFHLVVVVVAAAIAAVFNSYAIQEKIKMNNDRSAQFSPHRYLSAIETAAVKSF